MIPADRAWELLEPHLQPLPVEQLPRRDALGRVLAAALPATVDVPAEDVSAMDGYALGAGVAEGTELPVCTTVAAGDAPGLELPAGTAAGIMTGAPVPRGADRVVPVELTRKLSKGETKAVLFERCTEAGAHIRRRGEVLHIGDEVLGAGRLLTPAALSLLATHGYDTVPVHRAPRVSILATGDEVVPPDQTPAPGQLRDSHTDFLLAAGATLGLRFESLGIAPDRRRELTGLIRQGLAADVLLLSGGVSMGEFDLVEGVLQELGCQILFEKVAIQPAKPVVAAVHDGGLVIGLPGNPASAMVAFWLFVRPVLRRLVGSDDHFWNGALDAELEAPLPGAKGRDRFLPAQVRTRGGRLLAAPISPMGSHDLAAYAHGTALVRIPAHSAPAAAGTPCQVLPLADWPRG